MCGSTRQSRAECRKLSARQARLDQIVIGGPRTGFVERP
jgi:hypothetical protein